MLTDSEFRRLSDTAPIIAGDLSGFYVIYEDKRNRYCEYRFDIKQKQNMNTLVIYICTDKSVSIERMVNSLMVKELLSSLKGE